MKPSDSLFRLIRSMSKSEKGYFKKFSSLHVIGKQNNYIRLFDAIDTQQEYNEAAVKKTFKNEVFIKQLTATKNYLYNLILKSMRIYRSAESPEMQLKDVISDAEILFEKELFTDCETRLEKARRLSEENHFIDFLPYILRW